MPLYNHALRESYAVKSFVHFSLVLLLSFCGCVHAQSLEQNVLGLQAGLLNGQFFLALDVAEKTLAADEKNFGPEHPSVAASLNKLAALYVHQGKYAQAVSMYKRSLAIYDKALGTDSARSALASNPVREVVALVQK